MNLLYMFILSIFLLMDKQLYKRLCLFVGWSFGLLVTLEFESMKKRRAALVIVFVGDR